MKHVREELPDVQLRRPEVSSCAGRGRRPRHRARSSQRRYADATELIDDLEDALAIETRARGRGDGRGDRGPAHAARRAPPAAAAAPAPGIRCLVLLLLARSPRSRWLSSSWPPGAPSAARRAAATSRRRRTRPQAVLAQAGQRQRLRPARATGGEHPDEVKLAIDGDPNTAWTTENYQGGTPQRQVRRRDLRDADPAVAARAMQIRTPTPGWDGAIYVAPTGAAAGGRSRAGRSSASITSAKSATRVDLDTAGNRFRYYLVWITKLPPGARPVAISEIRAVPLGRPTGLVPVGALRARGARRRAPPAGRTARGYGTCRRPPRACA